MDVLKLGSKESFATARNALLAAKFVEPDLLERLEISTIASARSLGRQMDAPPVQDALDVCIRLFIDGCYVAFDAVTRWLGGEALEALLQLDLLRADTQDATRCWATVLLAPTHGIHIASDRESNPDLTPFQLPADTVYPAVGKNTNLFLDLLPAIPADSFLEMCGGAGAAALLAAARGVRESYSFDITARATHFAEFNRRLNGIENFRAQCGDLYEPANGETFDFIAAHPPYVPSAGEGLIFKEGGEDGEFIIRGIVEGLPKHLRVGGTFYCQCAASDREGEPLEQRLRRWLGEDGDLFDILLVSEGEVKLRRFRHWEAFQQRYKVTGLFYGSIYLRRHAGARPCFTLRRAREGGAGPGGAAWLMDAAAELQQLTVEQTLDLKPRIFREAELLVRHRWGGGEFQVSGLELAVRNPFPCQLQAEGWVVRFVEACDGFRSCAQIAQGLLQAGVIAEAPPAVIAETVRMLILNGLLLVSSLPAIK